MLAFIKAFLVKHHKMALMASYPNMTEQLVCTVTRIHLGAHAPDPAAVFNITTDESITFVTHDGEGDDPCDDGTLVGGVQTRTSQGRFSGADDSIELNLSEDGDENDEGDVADDDEGLEAVEDSPDSLERAESPEHNKPAPSKRHKNKKDRDSVGDEESVFGVGTFAKAVSSFTSAINKISDQNDRPHKRRKLDVPLFPEGCEQDVPEYLEDFSIAVSGEPKDEQLRLLKFHVKDVVLRSRIDQLMQDNNFRDFAQFCERLINVVTGNKPGPTYRRLYDVVLANGIPKGTKASLWLLKLRTARTKVNQ
jgi:hypothetical protein